MHILQIITRINVGGTAKWLDELDVGLKASGHSNQVLAGHIQGEEIEDLSFETNSGKRIPTLAKSISPFRDIAAFFYIRKLVKSTSPDIVNTHTSKAGLIARIAVSSLGKNRPALIHTYHGHLLYGYFNPVLRNTVTTIEKLLEKITDAFIVSGENIQTELIRAGIGSKKKYRLVHPGIRPPNFMTRKDAREFLGLSQDELVIGWLGRLVPIKRPDRVIELAKKFPSVTFILGGGGELLTHIESIAPDNLKVLGWSTPSIVWGASDLALLTSDNEAQPLSLVEASFAGIPSIAMDVGSVDEIVLNHISGLLVKEEAGLAGAIEEIMLNRDLLIQMGKEAKNKIINQFSFQQFISDHISIYQETIYKREITRNP